jgi:sugar/nucleoside kinase (ribokinase family)
LIKKVLGAGLIAVDHIFRVGSVRNTKKYSYLGSTGGGSVSNTLCMLSLLGYKTNIFGIVGNDYSERIASADFAKFNVDYSSVIRRGNLGSLKNTRQYSHLIGPNGRHSFKQKCLMCGHPFNRQLQMIKKDLTDRVIELASNVDLLHLDRANSATEELAINAIKNGHAVSFDFSFESYGPYRQKTVNIIELASLVKVTEAVFEKHIGAANEEGIRLWWNKYPRNKYLLVTKGEGGVYGYAEIDNEKKLFDLKAIPCEHLRDTAGAGDIMTAFALHNLLLSKPPTNEVELRRSINLCQALASLNCTLYGARAIQFLFLNQGLTPQQIMDWANKIEAAGKSGNSLLPLIGLRDRDRFNNPSRLAPYRVCVVCGAPLTRKSSVTKNRNYVEKARLDFVPWSIIDGFLVGKACRPKISQILSSPMIFVGSGGSLSASVFGEQLALRMLGRIAKAIPPFEFEGIDKLTGNSVVWLLSYGGKNPDIMGAAMKTAKLQIKNCIVLTGSRDSELAKFASDHSWATIFLKAEERGFVSTIGMLAMVSALIGLLTPDKKISEIAEFFNEENLVKICKNAERISKGIASNFQVDSSHIIALGSGWGWPGMTDFESKIVEGGICTVELSEIKNFTHGRYINALYHRQNRHFILFQSPSENEITTFFSKKLKRYFPQRFDVLRTDLPDAEGALDLVIQSMYLAFRLGEKAGRYLLKPRYPPEARGLYGWEPSERKTKKIDTKSVKYPMESR